MGGGADGQAAHRRAVRGPSPRGRGSLDRDTAGRHDHGSIPAWAGEPIGCCWFVTSAKVHPRVGGGAQYLWTNSPSPKGPSPRGRGSQHRGTVLEPLVRSIPAWAGEPWNAGCTSRSMGVHPRVGGGAYEYRGFRDGLAGPSPRGRGSLLLDRAHAYVTGSIPAWAGEPACATPRSRLRRVHPRVGGGANPRQKPSSASKGPSPRGRGSRDMAVPAQHPEGSIPAWAGEPRRGR